MNVTLFRFKASFRLLIAAAIVLLPTRAGAGDTVQAIFVPASSAHAAELPDDVWMSAPPVTAFVQRQPNEGAEPSEATEFRVAFDATTIFVRVRAFDREPEKIASYLTRRDGDSPCDWIRVFIDSYHDRRTAYEFAVNPAGVKQDRYWFNDTNQDDSWDAVWDVTVARDRLGWSAEFRIPLSQLRFPRGDVANVGFAVVREIARRNETATWPLLARSANGYVSSFGELSGLAMSGSPKRLELIPYLVGSLSRQPGDGNPLIDSSAGSASIGLDLRYRISSGLMLTGTVNPDFGQVEADPAVVNLTAFETFFNERRPFFVEGSGNYRFDADCYDRCNTLFYSRRIGRSPQGTSTLPGGAAVYTVAPPQTAIVGAAKLSGRIGRYSVGVMYAATKEEYADVLTAGIPSRVPVEPLTGYTVARARREFSNQSYIGFMGTATNRQVAGSLTFLPASAYTTGVDFDWRIFQRYSINGFVESSRVNGSTAAIQDVQETSRHYFQRPDLMAEHLDPTRTSLDGASAGISVGKIGGARVRFNSNWWFRSPGFDSSDLGFLQRADQRSMSNWLQLRSNVPNGWSRERGINFNYWGNWNYDGDLVNRGGNINGWIDFENNWGGGGGIGSSTGGLDDRMARGGPSVRTNSNLEAWTWFSTDNRRLFQFGFEGNIGSDGYGSRFRSMQPNVTVRPVPALLFSIGLRVNRNIVDSQWIENVVDDTTHYVFGHLDQTTVSMTGRLNYTMSPNLSLQLYAEPFVSGGEYERFKELADPRNADYHARYAPFQYVSNPDFNVKSFRTTNVLRWEYKPGSTLFVVWQQARENDAVAGPFRFGRDARAIFGVPPHNTFLVKLAYWLNY